MSNSLGHLFRITTFGESHGGAVGVVIDGCPSGHRISLEEVQVWLNRRRPGQSHLSSPRNEADAVECLSGMVDGITLGTPLTLVIRNKDQKKEHYSDLSKAYRPSHADYTTDAKWGLRAPTGGGRASARETIGRVAAAAVAEQILTALVPDLRVVAWVESVKDIVAKVADPGTVRRADVEETPLRCPDRGQRDAMEKVILDAKKKGDTVGGTIVCTIAGGPAGLGEPVFDKLDAMLARAMLSLPACRGFELGSGFSSTALYGSEHNDAFYSQDGQIRTRTNRSGGVQGGISNGEPIWFRVPFKPVATIFREQESVDRTGNSLDLKPKAGRHDPCVLPRAVPMVEAMALLTFMDYYLRQLAWKAARGPFEL